jgi:sugar phosphate isomerase/epimerase
VKLGFLTACMPERPLEDIAAFAAANGFEALELAAWPGAGNRPFVARHLAAEAFDAAEADRVRTALESPRAASPRTCARPSASSRRSSTTPASAACG